MAENKFSFSHLWPVYVLLAAVALQILFFPHSAGIILSLLAFAYVQNIAFALNSRSRNRSSAKYHFIAVLLATVVFFWMLERLIRSDLTLALILPYVAGTVAGSITGVQLSTWIEKRIGAIANIPRGSPLAELAGRSFFVQMRPTVGPLIVLVIYLAFQPPHMLQTLVILAGLLFVDNFSHTLSSRAGNRNKPVFIAGFAILTGVVKFLTYQRLVAYEIGWSLFVPYTVGGVSGSISGMLTSIQLERRTSASTDVDVPEDEASRVVSGGLWKRRLVETVLLLKEVWPIIVFLVFALILALAWTLIHPEITASLLRVYGLAIAQSFSFLLVSRARNRNVILYIALASVFSNGVWFLTFRELYVAGLELPFLVPYTIGLVSGSLLAYISSVWIERQIKAVADTPV